MIMNMMQLYRCEKLRKSLSPAHYSLLIIPYTPKKSFLLGMPIIKLFKSVLRNSKGKFLGEFLRGNS